MYALSLAPSTSKFNSEAQEIKYLSSTQSTISTLKTLLLVVNIVLTIYDTYLIMGNGETLFFLLKSPRSIRDILLFYNIIHFISVRMYAITIGWMVYVIASQQERTADELYWLKVTTMANFMAVIITIFGLISIFRVTWGFFPIGVNIVFIVEFVLYVSIVTMSFTIYYLLNELRNTHNKYLNFYTYPAEHVHTWAYEKVISQPIENQRPYMYIS